MFRVVHLNIAITCVVVLYLALGIAYGIANPIFESPDERLHFSFIRQLTVEKALPIQSDQTTISEYHQPPLYYLLGAAATFWIDTHDFQELLRANPFWSVGTVPSKNSDVKNQFFHDERENFPYRGTVLAVHVLRLVSTLFGAATVVLTYLISAAAFPRKPAIAFGASALVAFNPQFIYNSSSVSNDSLITTLCTAVVYALARWPDLPLDAARQGITLGLLMAAAMLTKVTAVLLVLPVAIYLAHVSLRDRAIERALRLGIIALTVTVITSGWWFARNWFLYREWSGMDTMQRVWGIGRFPPLDAIGVLQAMPTVWRSFWGYFGSANVPLDERFYQALLPLTCVSGAGLVIGIISFAKLKNLASSAPQLSASDTGHSPTYQLVLLTAWLVVLVAALARFIQTQTFTEFGRYLFPSVSSIALLLSIGLTRLVPKRRAGSLVGLIGVALFGLSITALVAYIVPAYSRPPALGVHELSSIPNATTINFDDSVSIVGYQLGSETVSPGQTLEIAIYWRAMRKLEKDYVVFLHLLTVGNRTVVAQRDTNSGNGAFPTGAWIPGETFRDIYAVRVPPDFEGPALLRVDVGLYSRDSMIRLPMLSGSRGYDRDTASLGMVKIPPKLKKAFQGAGTQFEDGISLAGYEVVGESTPAQDGRMLNVKLSWTTQNELQSDYSVFVHLVDGNGRIVAQHDGKPVNGNYPTSDWQSNEIIGDDHPLLVPSSVSPGDYRLLVGMYALDTMRRLRVVDRSGRDVDSAVAICTVSLK
ncbi:MAG: glycosyltransferase family 39 protein [Chloroflexi bacterium]|nr:glycosyltransferase family 39 protein [Chloroflexota bacterium]